jgi:hypothetical protein
MTGLVAGAFGVGAVAVVVLAGAVLSLRSRVDVLSRRLDEILLSEPLASEPLASEPVATGPSVRPTAGPSRRDAPPREARTGLGAPSAAEPPLEPDRSSGAARSRDVHQRPIALITAMASEPADEITPSVTRVVSVTFAGPLIKVAALSHGLQHALREESRMRIGYAVRRELKRQRKLRRRQPSGRAAPRRPVRDAAQGGRA